MSRSLLIPTLAAASALLAADAGRADAPATGLRFTAPRVVIRVKPLRLLRPDSLSRAAPYPMPIVVKDPSLYPIKVVRHNPARFPIRILTPDGLTLPGDGSTPPPRLQLAPPLRIPLR